MPSWVAFLIILSTCMAFGAEMDTPVIACSSLAGPVSTVNTASCIWDTPVEAGRNANIWIDGGRSSISGSATPVLFAGQRLPTSNRDSPGLSLGLQRLVLVGFDYAGVGSTAPLLWPAGLLDTVGTALNLTDVRLVTSNQELFNSWLKQFTSNSRLEYWTDNSTFLYIHYWADSRTRLTAVGLLVQAAPHTPNPLQLPPPLVQNALVAVTNSTLVPSLLTYAAIATPQPLLMFITTNVSLGSSPRLPPAGVPINRPVVFVGLQSLVTSVDFQMIVNQLNATGSKYSNITFVGVVLENLAAGDAVTSMVAAPFSIAISNNVWAAYYNRTAANDVRLALFNSTMSLPSESEMAYVTYMFTMYTSSLPYLRQQTSFYSDVLHLSILQFFPGPGSRAITVSRLKSWYHWWRNVVLTTDHVVATPLQLPPRQLVLQTPTRVSPLVQAVHSADKLKSSAEMVVVGDRAHILLLLANMSMDNSIISTGNSNSNSTSGSASNPIQLNSVMSWVGSSPVDATGAEVVPEASQVAGARSAVTNTGATVSVGFGYLRSAVIIPDGSPRDALQMQQLVLTQLPQGAGVASALAAGRARVPAELWTMLVWSVERPLQEKTLNLDGILLLLPEPELAYISSSAAQATDFVIELAGDNGNALTFQKVKLDGSNVRVGTFQGPGMTATNLTLGLNPAAVAAMPGGYVWPDPATLPQPSIKQVLPPWVIAVIAVAVTLAACMVAFGAFLLCRSHKLPWCLPRGKQSLLEAGSMRSGSACSYPRRSIDSANFGCSPVSQVPGQKAHGLVGSEARLTAHLEPCTTGTQDSVSDMTAGQKVCGPLMLDSAAEQKASRSSKCPGETDLQQFSNSSNLELPQHDADATALRDAPVPVHVADSLADSVAAGMQRWRAAVSSTTMLLMERRLDAANLPLAGSINTASVSSSNLRQASNESKGGGSSIATPEIGKTDTEQQQAALVRQPSDACLRQESAVSQYGPLGSTPPQLQLLELLGQGSCGCVYLAMWRGKRVAVKVMHLPANALLAPHSTAPAAAIAAVDQAGVKGNADSLLQRRRARMQQQNSAPHMAIMEAVLSSTMCHPNVVQVYTYMLNPLTRTGNGAACNRMQNTSAAWPKGQDIAGWELKLVMEYCNEGSLRDALDCGLLAKPGGFPAPSLVLTLAHDVAAAMLHLHSEGIVHADLKAANVMLTAGGEDLEGVWAGRPGGRHLIAKVADFGLAMPLDPLDTHATLSARGTPTHMSPELFMSGHVSKACDVWAFGILLYELITGQRAYAGVPIPLLPHEVARQGLRPTWPDNLPPGCRDLKKLAESCWMVQPQDRPSFVDIMRVLDLWEAGGHGFPLAQCPAPAAGAQQQQQQQQQETAARQAIGPAAASAAVLQRRQVQIQVQVQGDHHHQQQQQAEDAEEQPGFPGSPGQLSANGASSPSGTAHRPGAARVSPAASRQQTCQGRNRHMDWSEVDFAA